MPDQGAVAVQHHQLNIDFAIGLSLGDLARLDRDPVAERHGGALRQGQRLHCRVGAADPFLERFIGAERCSARRKPIETDLAASGMEIERAFRKLAHLAEAAGQGQARNRMMA